jgi:hypothetical protein
MPAFVLAERRRDPVVADTALARIGSQGERMAFARLPLAMTGWFDLKAIRSSA